MPKRARSPAAGRNFSARSERVARRRRATRSLAQDSASRGFENTQTSKLNDKSSVMEASVSPASCHSTQTAACNASTANFVTAARRQRSAETTGTS
eukprot:scaffold243637_cov42-Prasinocladus_malaysianus.AAC.1